MSTGGETKRKASLPATRRGLAEGLDAAARRRGRAASVAAHAGDRGGRAGGARRGRGGADRAGDRLEQGAQRGGAGPRGRAAACGEPARDDPRAAPAPARRRRAAPAAGAPDAEVVSARETLLRRVETAISEDARARADAGELEGRPQGTQCEPYPKRTDRADWPDQDPGAARGVYDCLVFVRAVPQTETNVGGQVGYPFRAVLDFDRFSVAWCKTDPVPGERVVPDPRTVLELPQGLQSRALAGEPDREAKGPLRWFPQP